MPLVHPSAVVAPGAQLGPHVQVGPYAVVGPHVTIGAGTRIGSHAVIDGVTRIGLDNVVGPHAVIGAPPQLRGCAAPGELQIGDRNHLRELCTVHAGGRGSRTLIGHDNLLMAYSHVAHDCQLGNGIELANGVQLAGHVQVGDHAVLGGLAAVHQFVRIGAYSMVGAGSMVSQDVLPYCIVAGDRARLYGANVMGLRRHGFDAAVRRRVERALRLLRQAPTLAEALAGIGSDAELSSEQPVQALLIFAGSSQRGLCPPVRRGRVGC